MRARLLWAGAMALMLHSFLLLISFSEHKQLPVPAPSGIAVKMAASQTETEMTETIKAKKAEIKNNKEIPVIEEHETVPVKQNDPIKKKKIQEKAPDTAPQQSPAEHNEITDRQEQERKTPPSETVTNTPVKVGGAGLNPKNTDISTKAVPLYEHNPAPRYPALARKRGIEGTVLLNVLVDSRGKVADLLIAETSGHNILDKAAIRAVERWIFSPGKKNNENTDMWVHVPIRFALQD